MKRIKRHRKFVKNYKQRIAPRLVVQKQFEKRLTLFIAGIRGYPLYDHALGKRMKGLRSFSVAGDIRVVYRETETYYEFLDVGTHNQIYK